MAVDRRVVQRRVAYYYDYHYYCSALVYLLCKVTVDLEDFSECTHNALGQFLDGIERGGESDHVGRHTFCELGEREGGRCRQCVVVAAHRQQQRLQRALCRSNELPVVIGFG